MIISELKNSSPHYLNILILLNIFSQGHKIKKNTQINKNKQYNNVSCELNLHTIRKQDSL